MPRSGDDDELSSDEVASSSSTLGLGRVGPFKDLINETSVVAFERMSSNRSFEYRITGGDCGFGVVDCTGAEEVCFGDLRREVLGELRGESDLAEGADFCIGD